jgi:hypothetical protein
MSLNKYIMCLVLVDRLLLFVKINKESVSPPRVVVRIFFYFTPRDDLRD